MPMRCRGMSRLVVITIDASASGLGFVVGDPLNPILRYAGIFSRAQARNTSNWRESMAKLICLRVLRKMRPDLIQGAFIS